MSTQKEKQEIKRRMAGKGHTVEFKDGCVIITSTRKGKKGVVAIIPENNIKKIKKIPNN